MHPPHTHGRLSSVHETCIPSRARGTPRGQLYTSDALLAIVIFVFAITLIAALWGQLQNQMTSNLYDHVTQQRLQRVAETLFFTRGEPAYWHTLTDRNSVSPGLIQHGNEIALAKWTALRDWNTTDYPSLVSALGIPDLNFYITISDTNRTLLTSTGNAPYDVNTIYVETFPSTYSGRAVIVSMQAYRRTP